MTNATEFLGRVVGGFLRDKEGQFFCSECLAEHAAEHIGSGKAQARGVIDAMFKYAREGTGLFELMPVWPCDRCAVTNPCIGFRAT